MAHPRKKRRTQAPVPGNQPQNNKTSTGSRIPKSMVIRMGASDVGPSVTRLVQDTRNIMEPHTASRLKERRANRLRDYATMAGPLGVSHLLLFSRAKESGNVNLRLAITPRGPTLNFRVEKYSLCKDIAKSQKRPKGGGGQLDHVTPPLLVMNNFNTSDATADSKIPRHLEQLLTSTFQSLFPPIAPQSTPLPSIRRVLLLNRETSGTPDGSYVVNLRHYNITSRILHKSLSRGIKRLQRAEKKASQRPSQPSKEKPKSSLPNLHRLDDIADYVLDGGAGGFTSGSETELDTDAEVDVVVPSARKVMNKRDRARYLAAKGIEESEIVSNDGRDAQGPDEATKPRRAPPVQKRAIKLTEIGPRMRLRLVKVEEGLCEGKVLWHEYISKTREEEREQEAVWDRRKKEKEERKRIQRENLAAKKKANAGTKTANGEADEAGDDDFDDYEDDLDLDDDEWDGVDGADNAQGQDEDEGEEEMEVDESEEEEEDEEE